MSRTTKVILCDSLYNDDRGVLAIAFALWRMWIVLHHQHLNKIKFGLI